MAEHRTRHLDPYADQRIIAAGPRRVKFILSRFWGRCYWCGLEIQKGEAIAYYADESEIGHLECHRDACT